MDWWFALRYLILLLSILYKLLLLLGVALGLYVLIKGESPRD